MSKSEQLTTSWNAVFEGSQKAINWVMETRSQSQRLDNESGSLTEE